MPISTTCPTCQAIFRLPEALAGKKVKCQKCEGLFVVPISDADTLAPAVSVGSPEAPKKTLLDSAVARTKLDPARPDDIPVTAQFADDDDDDADEPARSKPRRGERRPRRDQPSKSPLLPILLALGGLALLACLSVGGVLSILFFRAEKQREFVVPAQPGFGPAVKFKNGGGKFKNGPGGRAPNLTPTIELKLGEDGTVRVDSELALQDALNPDQQRHKHYAIELEEGKRYQIEMNVPKTIILNNRQMKQFDAYLILLDDMNKIVAENDDIEPPQIDKPGNQDSRIIYTAPRTAVYKIEATFFDNHDGLQLGQFILTVKRLPD